MKPIKAQLPYLGIYHQLGVLIRLISYWILLVRRPQMGRLVKEESAFLTLKSMQTFPPFRNLRRSHSVHLVFWGCSLDLANSVAIDGRVGRGR